MKWADLKYKNIELLWSLVIVCRLPPFSSHSYHTGLWHFKCPTFGSVCSSFGPALPPCLCLCLCLCLLPTMYWPLQPLSSQCNLPSAPLSAAAGLSSGLSCCWCSLNKMWTLIPAWSRMLQKIATGHLSAFDRVRPRHLVQDILAVLGVVVHHRVVLLSPH